MTYHPTTLLAIELARKLEPLFRAQGYHLGLTGSALYWQDKEPEDIDLFTYWHGDQIPACTPEELLTSLNIKFLDALADCRQDYPSSRKVLKSSWRGIPVDFIFFTPATEDN